ncbi:flagellar biosynthesis protein FlhB [bacterium]|nr:flagellar biosynthesis protein FlhB [bacterium]
MSSAQGEKTEEATAKRKRKAKERGQVPKSKEVNSVMILTGALIYFHLMGIKFILATAHNIKIGISRSVSGQPLSAHSLQLILKGAMQYFAATVLPLMGVLIVIVIAANVMQGGFVLTTKPLEPKFSKLNPLQGFSRIFGSFKTIAETVISIVKLSIVALIGYFTIQPELMKIPIIFEQSVTELLAYLFDLAFKLVFRILIFLILLAIFDFYYRRFEHKKSLRMTKKEVKDEYKEMEGDPMIKRRIRQKQFDIARRRMMSEVPQADVVITNPTRLAVALQYIGIGAGAPVVLAKGSGTIAKQIIKIATENDVPIVENKPLARALYGAVEPGDVIPENLYKAVASVLAYVYRLKNRTGQVMSGNAQDASAKSNAAGN